MALDVVYASFINEYHTKLANLLNTSVYLFMQDFATLVIPLLKARCPVHRCSQKGGDRILFLFRSTLRSVLGARVLGSTAGARRSSVCYYNTLY